MPPARNGSGEPAKRLESFGVRSSLDAMERRSLAFQRATNRKGMPMVWGTGQLRTDNAWKRDREYRLEDAAGKPRRVEK